MCNHQKIKRKTDMWNSESTATEVSDCHSSFSARGSIQAPTGMMGCNVRAPAITPIWACARLLPVSIWPHPMRTGCVRPHKLSCRQHVHDWGHQLCLGGCKLFRTTPSIDVGPVFFLHKELDHNVSKKGGGVGVEQGHSRGFVINVHHNVPTKHLATPKKSGNMHRQQLYQVNRIFRLLQEKFHQQVRNPLTEVAECCAVMVQEDSTNWPDARLFIKGSIGED